MSRLTPPALAIDGATLMQRLRELGAIGRDEAGGLSRLALTEQDKAGRDCLVRWMKDAGLKISVDAIGNIFGTWMPEIDAAAVMIGSHIDTVVNAGIYDGCTGVLSGLAVMETLQAAGLEPHCPIIIAAFTNEEGARYAPDMMGSLVYAGGLALEEALSTEGTDGSILGDELRRIGYAGSMQPGAITPRAFLELHVEQGPVLEAEGIAIGAVENLQGISWQRVVIDGDANHAGTTPTGMRRDAGLAAARVVTFLRDYVTAPNAATVATVGTMQFEPDVINVIPSRAIFTVDLRDPDEDRLRTAEAALRDFLDELGESDRVSVSSERLARFEPVEFDENLATLIEASATERNLTCRRMTSGAGHDAQMMARICPSAMIFVPSTDGISHNPREHTHEADLIAGANVLLDVARALSDAE